MSAIRSQMRLPLVMLVCALALIGAGCGEDAAPDEPRATDSAEKTAAEDAENRDDESKAPDDAKSADADDAKSADAGDAMATGDAAERPPGEDGLRVAAGRAVITSAKSEFGTVLFDGNGQVVYAFELDTADQSRCVDAACVKAWPPVLTQQAPTAKAGVNAGLLGTIRRGDGTMQVTYAGRPLYFYEHEAPGEIRCHDVDLNGGLWWVVKPDGKPVGV